MIDIDFAMSGPLFDGRYEQGVRAFLDAAVTDVAEVGLNLMMASSAAFRYEASLPTNLWLNSLNITGGAGSELIIEDPVVYNAWLEGVSSRNRTSRFKGYRIWRLATQRLQAVAPVVAERTLARYIGRLG